MVSRGFLGVVVVAVLLFVACSNAQPEKWFLEEQEIDASRAGVPREKFGIHLSTDNNDITPLIDGENFMKSLYEDIEATQPGDYVHGSMFNQNFDLELVPDVGESSKFGEVLSRAIRRGVTVRILSNINAYLPTQGILFCKKINAVCGFDCCNPDSRHSTSGSAHVKAWIIQRNGEAIAYLGGMDVTQSRWDTRDHVDPPARQREPQEVNVFFGWHDVMVMVRGPAVEDVARHFWARWNDDKMPMTFYHPKPYNWEVPAFAKPEALSSNLRVQVLQTFSCDAARSNGYYQKIAPHGEFSFAAGFKKLVGNAQRFLYLADQFMYFDEALAEVAKALPRLEAVIIVTDAGFVFSTEPVPGINITIAASMRSEYQRRALSLLTKDPELAKKVHVFDISAVDRPATLKNIVYVHSKVYIADDEFMIVGSAGVEQAGFYNDVEMSVGIYDLDNGDGPNGFVAKFRKNLWSEYLMISEDEPILDDITLAVGEWDRQGILGTQRVRQYWPPSFGDNIAYRAIYNFYEPNGRC